MNRNYKAFGLALVAMLALGAFVAQAASAKPLTVEVGQETTVHLTGNQEESHKFVTSSGTVTCTSAVFNATAGTGAGGAIDELTVFPTYTGCTAFGFATAHVSMNGCTYTFTTPSSIGSGVVTWGASQLHIKCSEGRKIQITPTSFGVSVCTQFVEEQTPTSGHVIGKNVASSNPMDMTLEAAVTGLHYFGSGGLCGDSSTHTNGAYIGSSTWKCFTDTSHAKQVGCTFS